MTECERFTVAVECRAATDGPRLDGVLVQEGRAATGGRAELFAPGAVIWPARGIAIRGEHLGAEIGRAIPERTANGEIRISTAAGPAILAAVEQRNRRFLSVEFYPISEHRTPAGVREITRALVDGAALTDRPEYAQARAEVRERGRRVWL